MYKDQLFSQRDRYTANVHADDMNFHIFIIDYPYIVHVITKSDDMKWNTSNPSVIVATGKTIFVVTENAYIFTFVEREKCVALK